VSNICSAVSGHLNIRSKWEKKRKPWGSYRKHNFYNKCGLWKEQNSPRWILRV